MTNSEPTTPRRRLRPRLSLRALMLIVLVVGAGLGWWAADRALTRRHDEIGATLQSAGIRVSFGNTRHRQILVATTLGNNGLPQSRLTADQTRALGQCPDLLHLSLATVITTDETMAMIARSSRLDTLYCFQPEVTDSGLAHLARLDHLRLLYLIHTPQLTDAGLGTLGRVANLEKLTISGANIQGAGISHLANLKRLSNLAIPNNRLTDAGLAPIEQLTRLNQLDIAGGDYSDSGLAHLKPLTGLKGLGFGSTRCTPAAFDHLAGMGSLETLTITGPSITDEWLDRVATRQSPSLRAVFLNGPSCVGEAAIARLHDARPEIQLTINRQPR